MKKHLSSKPEGIVCVKEFRHESVTSSFWKDGKGNLYSNLKTNEDAPAHYKRMDHWIHWVEAKK